MTTQKQLVSVKTGEPYQPVRIYYQVFKQKTVMGALQKLKCIEYQPERDRWNWLYEGEAKKLHFNRSYNSLTPADKPLILGYFTFRGQDQMLFDLRSSQRALAGLDFFDKRFNRYAANPTHLRIVNRLFSVDEMPNREIHPSLDPFFDREDVPCLAREMEEAIDRIEQEYGDDSERRQQAMNEYMDRHLDRPHPEIEEIIIHPEKIERLSLPMVLQMRQVEAYERWRGNFTFRSSDLIKQWVESISDEWGDELLADELLEDELLEDELLEDEVIEQEEADENPSS